MERVFQFWWHAAFAHGGRIGGALFWWTAACITCLAVFSTAMLLRPRALRLKQRPLFLILLGFWATTAFVSFSTCWSIASQLFAGGLGYEGRELYWERWQHLLACVQMLVVCFAGGTCLTAVLVLCSTSSQATQQEGVHRPP